MPLGQWSWAGAQPVLWGVKGSVCIYGVGVIFAEDKVPRYTQGSRNEAMMSWEDYALSLHFIQLLCPFLQVEA